MYNKLIEFRQEIIGALYKDKELFPQGRKDYEFEIVDANHSQIRGAWGHFSDCISLWMTSPNGKVHFCVLEAGNNVFNRDDCNYYFLIEIDAGNKKGESLKLALRWNQEMSVPPTLIEEISQISAKTFSNYRQEMQDVGNVLDAIKNIFLKFCEGKLQDMSEREQYIKQIEYFINDDNTDSGTLSDEIQIKIFKKHKIDCEEINEVWYLARNILKKLNYFYQLSAEDILTENYTKMREDKEFEKLLNKFLSKVIILGTNHAHGLLALASFFNG